MAAKTQLQTFGAASPLLQSGRPFTSISDRSDDRQAIIVLLDAHLPVGNASGNGDKN